MESHYKIAIIGGGISGISFAHFAAWKNYSSIIIEARDKIGGCIETYYSTKAHDFWLELGTHTVYNSYQHLIDYCNQKGLLEQLQKRNKYPFKLLINNKICSIIPQLNLMRAGLGWPLFKFTTAKDKSVKEYFSFVFGKQNYNTILRYCFDAVLCQNSRDFPADFLFKTRKKNKNLPRSFTFKNGMSSLFNNCENEVFTIRTNTTCNGIYYQNNTWHIKTNHSELTADKLILATPWHITQKLLKDINHPLADLPHQPTLSNLITVALIVDQDKVKHIKPLNGLIGVNQSFYSIVSRDVIDHEKYRGFTIHFKPENHDIISLITKFLAKLNIPNDALIDTYIKTNSLPCYQTHHSRFLTSLNKRLVQDNSLYLTGNYLTRLAVEDCVKRSYEEFLRLVSKS